MTTGRGLQINAALFATLMKELAGRGGGLRESGAFLLASTTPGPDSPTADTWQVVTAIAYYDDLDPASLTGGITFGADGYTALGIVCRMNRLRVVGDIHTHPNGWVDQSGTDAAHPMTALPGHIAFIAPGYAQGVVNPGDLGAHLFGGARKWTSYFGDDVAEILCVTGRTSAPSSARRTARTLRNLGDRVRRLLTPWKSR